MNYFEIRGQSLNYLEIRGQSLNYLEIRGQSLNDFEFLWKTGLAAVFPGWRQFFRNFGAPRARKPALPSFKRNPLFCDAGTII